MLIPVSWLECFSYCKRKWFLENVLGISRPPKSAMLCGSIKHAVLDRLKKAEADIVCRFEPGFDFESLMEAYERALHCFLRKELASRAAQFEQLGIDCAELYAKIAERLRKEVVLRAQHIHSFSRACGLGGAELWKAMSPKLLSEVCLESNALGLRGRLDLLEKHDQKVIPIELKSGSAPAKGVWPGHRLQLGAYAMLSEERFQCRIDKGYVYYVDCGARRAISINPFLREEVLMAVAAIREMFRTRKIPSAVGGRRCEACGLRRQCSLIRR